MGLGATLALTRFLRPGRAWHALAFAALLAPIAIRAQGVAQPGQPAQVAPPPPPQPAAAPKKPAMPAVPIQWWCEVNALPAGDSVFSADEAGRNFFVSQIIARPHTVDPDEPHVVTRICRTAFEVQFGAQWRLVTARAQQAQTVEAARLARLQDLRVGNHEGHERTFRIPDWHG
jgi:hypothetical protein